MSPLSTNANLCRFLIRPFGERSKASMMYDYQSFIVRRSEFAESGSGGAHPWRR